MSEFEKEMIVQMSSTDRIRLWFVKASELIEVIELMTPEDKKNMKHLMKKWSEEDGEER